MQEFYSLINKYPTFNDPIRFWKHAKYFLNLNIYNYIQSLLVGQEIELNRQTKKHNITSKQTYTQITFIKKNT